MSLPDRATVITTWIRQARERQADDFCAWSWFNDQVNWDATAEEAWTLVVELVRAAPDELLERVGAGPLEHVITRFGVELIDRVESEAERDARFRETLGTIWLRIGVLPPEIEARVVAASGGIIEPFELTPEQVAAIDAELARETESGRANPRNRQADV